MNNSSSGSITALVPGGVVTTQNISTVIKPKENNNSMQFVKIQTPELSKKAVEQIRVAEEGKISKDKIKEVEEEWQSNLLNWKSKRRQQFVGIHPESSENDEQNSNKTENSRKIKTFAEMIEQRAKAGNRLNFHLQRYIGDDEDNNNDENDNNFNPNNNSNNNNNNHDSDEGSANSSKAVDSKHSSSQSVANDNQIEKDEDTHDEFDHAHLSRIDNSNSGFRDIVDENDDREIDHEPINSTFKQGIERPPTTPAAYSDVDIKPMLEVDTKLDNGLHLSDATKNDDNGSDYDEEEEEQGEEQKHLQRIAFVAKLNAFERMTKPTIQEPKFVPTRTVKAPPPPPLPSKTQSFTNPKIQPTIQKNDVLAHPHPRSISVTNTTSILIQQRQSQQQPSAPLSPQSRPSPQSISKQIPQPIPKQIPQPIPKQTTQPIPKQTPRPISPQNPRPQISQTTASQQPPAPVRLHHSRPVPQQSLPQPIQHSSMTPSPPQQRLSTSPLQAPTPNKHQTISQQQQKIPHTDQPLPQPPPRQEPRLQQQQPQQRQQQSSSSPPQMQQQLQPPTHSQLKTSPQPHSKTQPQQQQSLKDKAQDRTVLSVSGKKRCSSCKEELGRGAAAFVIESLNLVYHTNCFRCSVCHVNLSNGFRGVDVRVHTGALHCQNCYSKDGLNYSRV